MTFGQRLSEARINKGIKQDELGKQLNVSAQTVRRWEYDKNFPDINQLKHLCSILSVSPSYLLDGRDEAVSKIDEDKKDFAEIDNKVERSWVKIPLIVLYSAYIAMAGFLIAFDFVAINKSIVVFPFAIFAVTSAFQALRHHGIIKIQINPQESSDALNDVVQPSCTILKTVVGFFAYVLFDNTNIVWSFCTVCALILLIGIFELVAYYALNNQENAKIFNKTYSAFKTMYKALFVLIGLVLVLTLILVKVLP